MRTDQDYEDELEHILPRPVPVVRTLKVMDHLFLWGLLALALLGLWLVVRGIYLAVRELVQAL